MKGTGSCHVAFPTHSAENPKFGHECVLHLTLIFIAHCKIAVFGFVSYGVPLLQRHFCCSAIKASVFL
jgi:hypothetical protein